MPRLNSQTLSSCFFKCVSVRDLDTDVVPNVDLLQNPLQAAPVVPLSFFVLCETCLLFLPPLLLCVFAVVTWKTCVVFLPVC